MYVYQLIQTNYNFREYFLRRTRDQFRAQLFPDSSEEAKSLQSSATTLANTATGKTATLPSMEPLSAEGLAKFYVEARQELRVLQRAAVTSMMYSSDRLVVEDEQKKEWIIRAPAEGQGEEAPPKA